jgi:molecular chaperone GrpE
MTKKNVEDVEDVLEEKEETEPLKKEEPEVTEKKKKKKSSKEIIEDLELQIKELKNTMLKDRADLVNVKKRLEKERILERKYAAMNISKSLITPLDHFELALKHEAGNEENKSIMQGFKIIKEQFVKALEEEGVSEVDALGEDYDPNFHQAIMTEKVEGTEPNKVLEVLQKGYSFKDRLIRPAVVKISE